MGKPSFNRREGLQIGTVVAPEHSLTITGMYRKGLRHHSGGLRMGTPARTDGGMQSRLVKWGINSPENKARGAKRGFSWFTSDPSRALEPEAA